MPPVRLSALDASFLTSETPSAHMHVGWTAVFDPPLHGPPPTFAQLRDHIAARVGRASRYRQRLAPVPFGVHDPVWVDDEDFDINHHVLHAAGARHLGDVASMAMSSQLERSRPLWEIWVAERLANGRIGVAGKVHHCMVDGLAAVELAGLLLDPTDDPPPERIDRWRPAPRPSGPELLAQGLADRVREELGLMRVPARVLASPRRRLTDSAVEARRAALALSHSLGSRAPDSRLHTASSALRHLGTLNRPLDELRAIKIRHDTTVNDVVLAVCAGGIRRYLQRHGDRPTRLKAMVPVTLRAPDAAAELGNGISFIFLGLPCDEPDAVQRLRTINKVTTERKRNGEPRGADSVLRLVAHTPPFVQHATARLVASPRTFNLVISNIPGPAEPLYMRGCRLVEAYPVVPLAERHAVSIGVTSVGDRACFGLYADRKALPDLDALTQDVEAAVDELLELSANGHRPRPRVPLPDLV